MRTRRGSWSMASLMPGPRHDQAGASSCVPGRRETSSPGAAQLPPGNYSSLHERPANGKALVVMGSSFSISLDI
jgi:hypothetical protein